MNEYFSSAKTGKTLKTIARWLAFILLGLLAVALVLSIVLNINSYRIGFNFVGALTMFGISLAAVIAGLFSCILLHSFGVLVDSAYRTRAQAEKQTELLRQLVAMQSTPTQEQPVPVKPVKPAPAKPVPAPVKAVKPAETPAKPAPVSVKPVELPLRKEPSAMEILGEALACSDAEVRRKYLTEQAEQTADDQVRDVCQRAIGMTEEQLVDLIGALE